MPTKGLRDRRGSGLAMAGTPDGFRILAGSERSLPRRSQRVGLANPNETLTVSLRLRPRPGAPALPDLSANMHIPRVSREDFAALYGTAQTDFDRAAEFAAAYGLEVIESVVARRTISVSGTVAQVEKAFQVQLGIYQAPSETFRSHEGPVFLPEDIADVVESVFGLENRPLIQLRGRVLPDTPPAGTLTPPEVARLYDFPLISAAGQTIGIIEFGGGFQPADVEQYFADLSIALPSITTVLIDGATNNPSPFDPAAKDTIETNLDICIAGSAAPGAALVVYFAPLTYQGVIDAISTAVHDNINKPSVISISWGFLFEELNDAQDKTALDTVSSMFAEAALLGVTVLASSGDSGSDCGVGDGKAHVLYPASDPGVTAVGGTVFSNVNVDEFIENTWSDANTGITGGGVSDYFDKPVWQIAAGVPVSVNPGGRVGRGVPDVAAYVGPYYLYLYGAYHGPYYGTSASAPLYAALIALINTRLGFGIGFINGNIGLRNGLYTPLSDAFSDIADGSSNSSNGSPGYTADKGWDACTGLGSLRGNTIECLLTSNTPAGVDPGRWQVTLVNKVHSETSGRQIISEIAGPLANGSLWWLNEADAMDRLDKGINTFFVHASDGSQAEVVVGDALPIHRGYLTTTSDGSKEDNLASLPALGVTIFS